MSVEHMTAAERPIKCQARPIRYVFERWDTKWLRNDIMFHITFNGYHLPSF